MKFAEDIIIRPIMTEKSVVMQDNQRKFTFEVNPAANKIQIRDAVEKLFNVKTTDIKTMNYLGKSVERRIGRTRVAGRKKSWKKAIVTLKEGHDIDFFNDAV
ncbi:MAG: 50S ribosomal protein L23 [Deltaproteobacteria bacterium]|jgi:large subunit ribosomal protein L23|nr:50S ribosomal protein L23 [Deltaproteobacteria bacterium]